MIANRSLDKFLAGDSRGGVALIAALASLPLMFVAGAGVDYALALSMRTNLQSAVDSAALAATASQGASKEERISIAKQFIDTNMSKLPGAKVNTTRVNIKSNTIDVEVSASIRTSFMHLAGVDAITMNVRAETERTADRNLEIGFIIDYSGVMNGKGKYRGVANAVSRMSETISEAMASDKTAKFALVPYASVVRLSMDGQYVNGGTPGIEWTGCTSDRMAPFSTNDETPDVRTPESLWAVSKNPQDDAATGNSAKGNNGKGNSGKGNSGKGNAGNDSKLTGENCQPFKNAGWQTLPLTTDIGSITRQVDVMRPLGNTHIALGMAAGWALLSGNEPYDEGADFSDDNVEKIAVLIAGSKQSERAWSADGEQTIEAGNDNLASLCTNMKNEGILVVTISFDLNDRDTENALRECASDEGSVFTARTSGELDEAIAALSSSVNTSKVRLVR